MAFHGTTPTYAGQNLIAGLIGGFNRLTITRIVFGEGVCPDEEFARNLTDLIAPVAEGTSDEPVKTGSTIKMDLEYRNDLNGGLNRDFYIREFGVFALDENGAETLLYYGSSKVARGVGAFDGNFGIEGYKFPVNIYVGTKTQVVLAYEPNSLITSQKLKVYIQTVVLPEFTQLAEELIRKHNTDVQAHPAIRARTAKVEDKIDTLYLMVTRGAAEHSFMVDFKGLEDVDITGVWNVPLERVEF